MPTVSKSDWHKMLATVSPRREVEAVRRAPRVKKFIQHRTAVEGDVLTLDIPLETHNYKSAGRNRWVGGRETARQREIVAAEMLRVRGIHVWLPVVVTLVRLGPKKLDDDNLRFALSATRDSVAKAFGVDDADPRITFLYAQAPHSPYGVRLCIREAGRKTAGRKRA